MRVCIENMLRQVGATASKKFGYQYMLSQFTEHLQQLRDRTLAGDLTALNEFFTLYVFDDGKDYEDVKRPDPTDSNSVGSKGHAAAKEWRCFHCDEVFTDPRSAEGHFGPHQGSDPACTINIEEYRRMEEINRRHVDEDTELHRALNAKCAEMAAAVRQAEEQGYARGLEDAKKHPQELGLQRAAEPPDVTQLRRRIAELELREERAICTRCAGKMGITSPPSNDDINARLSETKEESR